MLLAEPKKCVRAERAVRDEIGGIQLTPGVSLAGCIAAHARDAEVFGEGEPIRSVYVVQSGVVRLQRILDDGRRQILSFAYPGDIIGLDHRERFSAMAEAVTDCEIGCVPRTHLRRFLKDNPSKYEQLWLLTEARSQRAMEQLVVLGRKCALERVAGFLLEVNERLGGQNLLRLPMPRSDIADYLGLTIETVSRTLAQLGRAGLIAMPSCRTILVKSPSGLRCAANGQSYPLRSSVGP